MTAQLALRLTRLLAWNKVPQAKGAGKGKEFDSPPRNIRMHKPYNLMLASETLAGLLTYRTVR